MEGVSCPAARAGRHMLLEISYSQLRSWRTCRLQHYYSHTLGIESGRYDPRSVVGSLYHSWAAKWYSLDPQRREQELAFGLVRSLFGDLPDNEENSDTFSRLNALVSAHYREFGPDSDIPISETEKEIRCNISEDIIFNGFVDGLVKLGDDHWILEHKTGRPDEVYLALMDEQSALYIYALHISGISPRGVIYNILNEPVSSPSGYKSSASRIVMERSIEECRITWEEFIAASIEMKTKVGSRPEYRSRGTHCRWCDYRTLCITELNGGDVSGTIAQSYRARQKGVIS